MVELYAQLRSYTHADAEPWQPDELQISMYKPAEYDGRAVQWPHWLPKPPAAARRAPPIEHAKTIEDVARIFFRVGPELEDALVAFEKKKGNRAVELDGEVWFFHHGPVPPAEL